MENSKITGRRHVLTNAVASWLSFAATVVVTFFMSPVLVHALGDRDYGVWALVESVLAYLTLFDLGIGAAVVRYVARFHETQEMGNLNRIFSTSLAIFATLGMMALAVTMALAFGWARPLAVPAELAELTRWLLVLLGLNLAVGLPLGVYDSLLCGLGQYPLRTTIQLGILACRTATFLWILRNEYGLLEIGLAITAFGVLQNIVMVIAAHWSLPNLRFSPHFVDRHTFYTIRSYSLWAFVTMIAGRISFSTAAIVIGAVLTPEHITYFAIASRLTEYCKNAVRAATAVLTPAVSTLEATQDFDAIRHIFIAGSRYVVWFILPIQLGLICLGYCFLSLWMDRRIAEASYVPLLVLSLPLTLTLSQSITGRIFYGMGRLRWFAWMTISEALANLLISLVLVRYLGIVGVAIGTAIPNVAFNLALIFYACRVLDVPIGAYMRGAFLAPLAAATGPLITWCTWRILAGEPSDWPHLLVVGSTGLLIYMVAGCFLERGTRVRLRQLFGCTRTGSSCCPVETSGRIEGEALSSELTL